MGWDVQVRVFDVQEAEKLQSQAAAEEVMRQCQAAAKPSANNWKSRKKPPWAS